MEVAKLSRENPGQKCGSHLFPRLLSAIIVKIDEKTRLFRFLSDPGVRYSEAKDRIV
jgi:hypothetical protein